MVETEIAILWGNVWRVAGDLLLSFRKCLAGNIGRKSIRYNLSGHSVRKKQWNTDRGRDSQKTAWQNDTDHLYFHLSGVCNAAFHIHPFDFLIKPLKEEDVYHVMDELCACTDSERQIFEYRNSEGMHRIAYREIMYFYSTEKTIHMVTEQGEKEFRGQISDVEKRTGDYFLKIHKSFLINRAYVECYRYDMVRMKNQTELSISKVNRKRVREFLLRQGEL